MNVEIASNHNRAEPGSEPILVKIIIEIVVAIDKCTEPSNVCELCHRAIGRVNIESFKLPHSQVRTMYSIEWGQFSFKGCRLSGSASCTIRRSCAAESVGATVPASVTAIIW